jgi:ABC-type lipoprotein release transport system permease subunit
MSLALLIALVGGTVLAGVSAANRTASAFPRYAGQYGFDAGVFGLKPFPKDFDHISHVETVAESHYYFNGNIIAGGHFVPAEDTNVVGLPSTNLGRTIKLLSGHLPVGAHDVLVGYSMQQQFGLHVGSFITVPFYAPSQHQEVINANSPPPAHGPRVRFRVVGVEVSLVDFPSSTPVYSLYVSNAFDKGEGQQVVSAYFAQVRLFNGQLNMPRYQYYINNLGKTGNYFVQNEDTVITAIEGSVHPQSVGWWLFALFAALAGFALIGQALSRQNLAEKESYPTLVALGLRPNQLFGLGMLRAGAIGAVGAIMALVITIALSPLTPVGEARAAELTRGLVFDGPILALGFVTIVCVVLALSAAPAWRTAQVQRERSRRDRPVTKGNSSVVSFIASAGSPPSALIGVRNALERGRGRSSVPVVTAFVATVLAVAALVASSIFGASLSNLLNTPRLYGANWQVDLANVSNAKLHSIVATYKHNPLVSRITYGSEGEYVNINGVPVQSIYVHVVKGPMVYSLASGRYPTGGGQMDLGQTTLHQVGARIGSKASVSLVDLKGAKRVSTSRIVGTVVIPPSVGIGGLGDGALMLIGGIERIACSTGPAAKPCVAAIQEKLNSANSWGVDIGVLPSSAGRRLVAHLQHKYAAFYDVQSLPTDLVNFGQAVDFPLLLGLTIALFGVATLTHLLFVSVTRRRRQFALLKVLGFVRRQVRSAICWQSTTIAVIGVVFGVPLGLVIGKTVWRDFAASLGAVPLAVVPALSVVLLATAIIVGAILLALVPANLAARILPAEALREV